VAGPAWVWVLPVALAGQCLLLAVYVSFRMTALAELIARLRGRRRPGGLVRLGRRAWR
jgi:hypothetical protein